MAYINGNQVNFSSYVLDENGYYTKGETENLIADVEKTTNKADDGATLQEDYYNSTKYPTIKLMCNALRGGDLFGSQTFESHEAVLDWVQNSAPTGCFMKQIIVSGSYWTYIIQKTSSQYAAVYNFNYGTSSIYQRRLYAGIWTNEGAITPA